MEESIPGSERPESHAATVWREVVAGCAAERLVIIAHSYGGVVTQSLATHPEVGAEVRRRVAAVLFTDSVHYGAEEWLRGVARNYVTSDEVSLGRSEHSKLNLPFSQFFLLKSSANYEMIYTIFQIF